MLRLECRHFLLGAESQTISASLELEFPSASEATPVFTLSLTPSPKFGDGRVSVCLQSLHGGANFGFVAARSRSGASSTIVLETEEPNDVSNIVKLLYWSDALSFTLMDEQGDSISFRMLYFQGLKNLHTHPSSEAASFAGSEGL